jgi:uncharacterized membrane protein YraQ (UPF0718 family)
MLEILTKTGFTVLANLIQIIISSIFSMIIYYFIRQKVKNFKAAYVNDILIIIVASFLGILLPLSTFGVLPILFVLLKLEFRMYSVLPIIFSNIIFNMLIPFNDPSFIWKIGIKRVILAFVIGIFAGIILKSLKNSDKITKVNIISDMFDKHLSIKSIINTIHKSITITGVYMIFGVFINTIINDYILYSLTSKVFSSQYTAFLPRFFGKYNVVHPGFLLAICIIYSLLNFTNLSAVLVILKPKGFIIYVSYFAVWAIILGSTIFLK